MSVGVVVAPAGYGKTSHVATWAQGDGRPIAWFELHALDNDPHILVDRLVELLGAVTDLDPRSISRSPISTAQFDTITSPALGASLRRCTTPFILVLDDVHRLESAVAVGVIDALVNNVPAHSAVVLVSRDAPRLSFAALRVTPGFVDVGAADLALDALDARALFDMIGTPADDNELDQLVARTEGWPVGIRFAAFAADRRDVVGHPSAMTDLLADRDISEYLRNEWVRHLAVDDVQFLRCVSGLDWLSGALADHALERSDSGAMLERLASNPSVVIPIDRRGSAYRLHHLMADALDADFERVDRDARRRVAQRASEWFEQSGDIDRAIHHALRSGDIERAARLVAAHGVAMHTIGHHHTVDRWITLLPRSVVLSSTPLCVVAALTALGLGDGETALSWLRFGDQAATDASDTDRVVILEVAALRSMLITADVHAALDDANRAYHGLPPGRSHAAACFSRGLISFVLGDDAGSLEALEEGSAEARVVNAHTIEIQCLSALAVVAATSGDWKRALPAARAARQLVLDHGLEHLPTLVLATSMSAWAEAQTGHHDAARADMLITRRNLAYLGRLHNWVNVLSRIALANAALLIGDRVLTRTLLDDATGIDDGSATTGRVPDLLADVRRRLDTAPIAGFGASSLTNAELRVLHYLPTNLSMVEIGKRLYVSRNTAKSHAGAIYRKLHAGSRNEAVEIAREAGLLPPI